MEITFKLTDKMVDVISLEEKAKSLEGFLMMTKTDTQISFAFDNSNSISKIKLYFDGITEDSERTKLAKLSRQPDSKIAKVLESKKMACASKTWNELQPHERKLVMGSPLTPAEVDLFE